MILGATLVGVSGLLLGWVYLGYPALAALKARFAPFVVDPSGPPARLVTIGIAAHDEARHLEGRIADVLAQRVPFAIEVLVASDGSTDESPAVLRRLAGSDARVRWLDLERGGQTAAQRAIFDAARGDVVVLTDAETRFAPGCLAALIRPFADPRVACVTGRLEWRDEGATSTSTNEGLYWRYERSVRVLESRAGFLTAVTGALLALRASAYRPVPLSASMDHLLPLYVHEQGGQVVYVPDAVATDRPISGLREQFRSRSRTATRGIAANLSMVGRLAPWRHPIAALAIWSHKLLRWATPWLVVAGVLGAWVLVANGVVLAAVIPLAAIGWVIAAVAAHLIGSLGRRPPRALGFARAFGVVNLAFALAWLNVLRGRRIEAWHRTDWRALPESDQR